MNGVDTPSPSLSRPVRRDSAVARSLPRPTKALGKMTWVEIKLVLRDPLTMVFSFIFPIALLLVILFPQTVRWLITLAVPWAILAKGPPWMNAGLFSSVCTRLGARASLSSTVIAPGAFTSAAVTALRSRV